MSVLTVEVSIHVNFAADPGIADIPAVLAPTPVAVVQDHCVGLARLRPYRLSNSFNKAIIMVF